MKPTSSLFLALTLVVGAAATGCATDVSQPGDPGTNPGGGDGGSDDAPHATNLAGKYTMRSLYDLATNMPGKIGTAANLFIAATDDADDPTNWLLEQMINAMPNGAAKTFLNSARGYVSGYLNDQLRGWAPDFVSTMIQVGADFGDMTKHFGMNETLTVTGANDALMSTHTVNGMHFKFGNQERDFAFADHDVSEVKVDNVGVTFDATGHLSVAQHQVPLKFGQVLRIGLDNGIIPLVDPNATDLHTLFAAKIDCYAVGGYVADAVGFGSASMYESACIAGIGAGANYLYGQISAIDSDALDFGIAGTARALDSNNDGNADKIQTGLWTGNLSYAGSPAPLSTATFHAERQ